METRGRSSIFRIWDLHSLAINFCWQWRLFIFGVSMIWTWCAVPLHKICIRHCTGINFIMYKRIIKYIKHWVYNYLNKSPTMFHGKINYKWQFSIAFCMFTRPGNWCVGPGWGPFRNDSPLGSQPTFWGCVWWHDQRKSALKTSGFYGKKWAYHSINRVIIWLVVWIIV